MFFLYFAFTIYTFIMLSKLNFLFIFTIIPLLISSYTPCEPETPSFVKKCIRKCQLSKCKTEIADHDLGKSCLAINDDSEIYGINEECDEDDPILEGNDSCINTYIRGQKWLCDKKPAGKRTNFCNRHCFYYRPGNEHTRDAGWDCSQKKKDKPFKGQKQCVQTDDYYYY